ncbi:MAG: hypothetical protein HQM13_15370 [SAR324 cluster bacterium]|nr:hypothetical protein [SAR324 cluster bacterium]
MWTIRPHSNVSKFASLSGLPGIKLAQLNFFTIKVENPNSIADLPRRTLTEMTILKNRHAA